MITITLLNGNTLEFPNGTTSLEVAQSIAKSLAKAAIAVDLDNQLHDLSFAIEKNCKMNIIKREDDRALELIRHDAAHVMAEAVQELFPGTQVTIGPVIENGFFYDFARKEPFTSDDLKKIEKKMAEIVDRDEKTYREVWKRDEAVKHFLQIGEKYKAEIIESIPSGDEVSIYHHGKWHDLCRGPHLASFSYN